MITLLTRYFKKPHFKMALILLVILGFLTACADKVITKGYNENISNLNKFANIAPQNLPEIEEINTEQELCAEASLTVRNIPLSSLASLLSKIYKTNINAAIVHVDKEFAVSMKLHNICLQNVLDELTDSYNVGYIKTAGGYNIFPPHIKSQVFSVDYHNFYRSGSSALTISSSQLSSSGNNGTTGENFSKIETKSAETFWDNIERTLNIIILDDQANSSLKKDDQQSQISVYRESGIIVARALPRALKNIQKFIEKVNKHVLRQVVIEAKILEIELNDEFNRGVQWDLLKKMVYTSSLNNSPNTKLGSATDIANITNVFSDTGLVSTVLSGKFTNKGNFDMVLQALSTQGKISVLASPRISALNNQRALMKYGDQRYFVTNVTNIQLANGQNGTSSQSGVDLTPFFSGVALDTTARIMNDKEVVLHIHPIITRVQDETKPIKIDDKNTNIPVAKVQSREADTIVKANSGDIVIIGGLSQNAVTLGKSQPAVPATGFFSKLMEAFTAKHHTSTKTEMIILLKPTIIETTAEDYKKDFDKFMVDMGF